MTASEVKITTGRRDYLESATELITKCFWDDPAIRFMLSDLSDERRRQIFPSYMTSLVKAAYLGDAQIDECNDFSSVAVWIPPEKRVDTVSGMLRAGLIPWFFKLGYTVIKRMLVDFQRQSDEGKRMGLRDAEGRPVKRYYDLFYLATDPKARGQGLASRLIANCQKQAAEEGVPLWLEATTTHSRDIYARCGFRVVKELRLGEGTHSAEGTHEKGGPGVTLYSMIWWPENVKH